MADQGKWFKLWISALSDPDLANLSNAEFGSWCKFGAYLKAHGTNGCIRLRAPGHTLTHLLQVATFAEALKCIALFPNCDVREEQKDTVTPVTIATVTWRNWHKYQGDMSAERVRKFRAVKRSKRRGEETRRDETRKDEKRRDETPLGVGQPPVGKPHNDTPHQHLINRFLTLKHISRETLSPAQLTGLYRRHGRSAVALLTEAGGLDVAIAALEIGSTYHDRKGLGWTLDTIAKHLVDIPRWSRDLNGAGVSLTPAQLSYADQLGKWLRRQRPSSGGVVASPTHRAPNHNPRP